MQGKPKQMNTNEPKARPGMISITNGPTLLTTNNVSVPKVSDSPSKRTENLENESVQFRKLQKSEIILDKLRETNTNELRVKLAIMSLINKPACLTITNDYVTEITDPPNGRNENSEYEINQTRTNQNKNNGKNSNLLESLRKSISHSKVIQDNSRPMNTNERLNPATTSITDDECTCSVYMLVSNTRKENLENELDQKRKAWNSDRRVQHKPRQTYKDELRAKPATVSIKQALACSTINNVSEPVVDSITNIEKTAMERIRKLRHRLDFPNEPRENLAQISMKNTLPCPIKKYVSVPDVSKPNWRMDYLERDTLRIIKNDVMCVNNVNQFLKTLFR